MDEPTRELLRPSTDGPATDRIQRALLALLIAIGFVLCLLLIAPFLGAITWALALAILFSPLHARLEASVGHPSLSAMISVIAVALIVAVPAIFVAERLVEQAADSAAFVQAKLASGAIQGLLDAHPEIAPVGTWINQQIDLPAMMASLATWLSNLGASFVRGSILQAIEVVLTFYLLFYFLRDRRQAQRVLRDLLPLSPAEAGQVFHRIADTIHATIYGTLAVAAAQGILGGLMFWFLGLPAPLLWGLVMGLLSVIPVLGAFVIWIPAAGLLALDGSWGKALILAAWGAVVVGSIDNVLRPVLVGGRLRLHTAPAFLSIVGGLVLFGAPGFILGPLVATITLVLLEIWKARAHVSPAGDVGQKDAPIARTPAEF